MWIRTASAHTWRYSDTDLSCSRHSASSAAWTCSLVRCCERTTQKCRYSRSCWSSLAAGSECRSGRRSSTSCRSRVENDPSDTQSSLALTRFEIQCQESTPLQLKINEKITVFTVNSRAIKMSPVKDSIYAVGTRYTSFYKRRLLRRLRYRNYIFQADTGRYFK